MKYSLSSRQKPEYLNLCDEITVQYNDRNIIYDLTQKYLGKPINLERWPWHMEDKIDWKEMERFNTVGNILFGTSSIPELITAKELGFKAYFLMPISTFHELKYLVNNIGVNAVILNEPLFFDMDAVAEFGVPVRAIANCANPVGLPYPDGVIGTWIRPEDVEAYEPYIDTIKFKSDTLDEERALYRIYAQQKKWPGDLGFIVKDLNYPGVNRMFPPDIAKARLNCRQNCTRNGACRLCYRSLELANPNLFRDYLNTTDQT